MRQASVGNMQRRPPTHMSHHLSQPTPDAHQPQRQQRVSSLTNLGAVSTMGHAGSTRSGGFSSPFGVAPVSSSGASDSGGSLSPRASPTHSRLGAAAAILSEEEDDEQEEEENENQHDTNDLHQTHGSDSDVAGDVLTDDLDRYDGGDTGVEDGEEEEAEGGIDLEIDVDEFSGEGDGEGGRASAVEEIESELNSPIDFIQIQRERHRQQTRREENTEAKENETVMSSLLELGRRPADSTPVESTPVSSPPFRLTLNRGASSSQAVPPRVRSSSMQPVGVSSHPRRAPAGGSMMADLSHSPPPLAAKRPTKRIKIEDEENDADTTNAKNKIREEESDESPVRKSRQ